MVGMKVFVERLSTETSTNGYIPFCCPLPPTVLLTSVPSGKKK
jgi:hypothetical protein